MEAGMGGVSWKKTDLKIFGNWLYMFLLGEDKCYEVELKLYGYAPHCQFYTSRVEKEGKLRMCRNILFQDIMPNWPILMDEWFSFDIYTHVCRYIYLHIYTVLSRSVISDSLQLHGLQPARFLCPWGFSRQEYCSGLPGPPLGRYISISISISIYFIKLVNR